MTVSELQGGKKYMCTLSNTEMLMVKVPKAKGEAKEGEKQEFEDVLVGKSCVMQPDGSPKFLVNEIHDGQMTELTN